MFPLEPLFLLLWIPLVLLAVLLIKSKTTRNSVAFTNFNFLRSKANAKYFLPQFFDFLALFILVLALARPVTLEKTVTPPVEGKDIMIALDVSGSMEALDFQPKNRITAAKNIIEEFVKGRKSDRLGLVFFAKESFLQVPLTTDYDIFNELLARVTTGVIEDGYWKWSRTCSVTVGEQQSKKQSDNSSHRRRQQFGQHKPRNCGKSRCRTRSKSLFDPHRNERFGSFPGRQGLFRARHFPESADESKS